MLYPTAVNSNNKYGIYRFVTYPALLLHEALDRKQIPLPHPSHSVSLSLSLSLSHTHKRTQTYGACHSETSRQVSCVLINILNFLYVLITSSTSMFLLIM